MFSKSLLGFSSCFLHAVKSIIKPIRYRELVTNCDDELKFSLLGENWLMFVLVNIIGKCLRFKGKYNTVWPNKKQIESALFSRVNKNIIFGPVYSQMKLSTFMGPWESLDLEYSKLKMSYSWCKIGKQSLA